MSYFSTLNQFVTNAEASRDHAEEFSRELKNEKVNTFEEKVKSHTDDIEKYGALIQGGGSTWHMGRKIFHHIKMMKEKARGKTTAQEETEEPKKPPTTEDPDYMGLTNEEAEELFKPEIHSTNTAENQDSSLNPSSEKHIEPEKEGPPEGEEARVTNEAPAVEESGADHAEMATSRVMGGRGIPPKSGVDEAPEPTQVSETNIDEKSIDEGLEAFKGKSGQLGAKSEEGGDGVSELIDGGSNAIKSGISDTIKQGAKKIAEKVGINTSEDIGEGVANAVLDAVPIVGEVAGLATLFGGLFHSMNVKKKEEMKAKAIDATTRGQAQVSGAIDVGAVLSQGAQSAVAGLV